MQEAKKLSLEANHYGYWNERIDQTKKEEN